MTPCLSVYQFGLSLMQEVWSAAAVAREENQCAVLIWKEHENLTWPLLFPLHNVRMNGYQALTKSCAVVAELVDAQR